MAALFPSMKRDSGPGHPWIALEKTKGGIIDKFPEVLIDAVLAVVDLWANNPPGTLPNDPVELIEQGFSAPMRVFVKNEPHNKEKISTGRLRLIIMVPIHLVLAEMLIFSDQNNEEIDHWATTPSKPGLGLAEDRHLKTIWEEVQSRQELKAEADVSGYDFSLCEDFFIMDARRRVLLAGAPIEGAFYNAVHNAHHVMCRSVYALSDGRMFKQLHPGVMKSGRYVTSSTNSFIRVMLAHSIGADWAIAMGDDSVESAVPGAIEKYAELGLKVKFYRTFNDEFEFCSHNFAGGSAYPSKPGKMLYNLVNQRGDFSTKFRLFQQWHFEMRHHPELNTWISAIERLGWSAQNDGTQSKPQTSAEEETA